MKCLELNKECIKVLGVHISCNKKLQDDKIFLAHGIIFAGKKDSNFQITHYFQNSILVTNINSTFCSLGTKTNTENLPMGK